MPRLARIVIPGCVYHVTQRGNNRQDVFFSDLDRQEFLRLLAIECEKAQATVQAYCLMINHVHLMMTPAREESLAEAMGRTCVSYAQYINRRLERAGHLWQDRFYSCPLDSTHFWSALIYVERNPVRSGLVQRPWDYVWSSAAVHCGLAADPLHLVDLSDWPVRSGGLDWRESLDQSWQDGDTAKQIRTCTQTGKPFAAESFITALEQQLGKSLRPRPRGRPKTQ